ncbi:ATP-binding protein [Variovorax sp. Sphag1AA]|uniref:PAS domain-containing hybrid sensor histidine kinase/response regulator n=1 Tax=Variovorax sp. Sphag1AA TaxID=2587027 RepID=UPI0016230B15|nr:ATP-binding protein [Variovorax sp. Sphag1AA]MBB3180638.1 PAS domain S-box-containing protein [Variovorax sp. Sphag1AA]
MEIKFKALREAIDRSGVATMALTCLLAAASYFFGHSRAIELHWFWVALASVCIVALSTVQFLRVRRIGRHDDELHAVMDAVPHILFFKDTEFRYRTINAAFCRAHGFDPAHVVGKTDKDLFPSGLNERFHAQDRELLASRSAGTFDETIELHGGAVRRLEARKQPVFDRCGKLRGIVGVAIDVTEQLAVQRQLEDLNARLGVALEAAQMGVWEWNQTTGDLRLDQRAGEILDLKGNGRTISDFFAKLHPDDVEPIGAQIEIARGGQQVGAYEFRIVCDSGEVRWVEGFMSMDHIRNGRHDRVIGVNRDITERREKEVELREAKSQADRVLAELKQSRIDLELALAIGGLGVWHSTTRLPKNTNLWNPAFRDTTIEADEKVLQIFEIGDHTDEGEGALTWRKLGTLVHPEDVERVRAKLLHMFAERLELYSDQFRVRRPSGVIRVTEVRARMVVSDDADVVVVEFTGIAKDITDEEALKANLVTKAEEARSAVDAKAHFLAMMSHEVRTPLNGVLGMIDLVLDTPLDDDQRTMLGRCRESSVSLLTIINDILDFSKIEARMLDIESRPLALAGLVEDVCATFGAETARKAIGLSFHVDPAIPQFVVGDSVRLRQVLTNLIGNAIKFTQQGSVRVEVLRTDKGELELAVQDTGIGIDPRAVRTLFEPFRQADIATTRRYGGTGLGLTIVKQLVELMHGSVRCESALGAGSRFIVTLPLRPWVPSVGSAPGRSAPHRLAIDAAVRQPVAKPSSEPSQTGQGQRVLLAEDHPINREVLTRQLHKLGYACDCAEDGQQAWEMLEAQRAPGGDYALLLTDCHMPRLDGYELTRRLRERERERGLPRLPIVALTANALQGEAERCLALGMDAYLSKPLQLGDLREALSKVLQRGVETDEEKGAVQAAEVTAPRYARLMQLCDGDPAKVAKLVAVFVAATEKDMQAMERAADAANHTVLRQLAHRMSSACHQLDEDEAVRAFKAVEDSDSDATSLALYPTARAELASVMQRATAFAGMHA